MFDDIKRNLSTLPILVSPPPQATLLVYLAVAHSAVNSVLVYEEGKKQSLVYFTSRTLQPIEERYQVIEKLVLALVFSARRLRHYCRSYQMVVNIDYPIKQILRRPKLTGRITMGSRALGVWSCLPVAGADESPILGGVFGRAPNGHPGEGLLVVEYGWFVQRKRKWSRNNT